MQKKCSEYANALDKVLPYLNKGAFSAITSDIKKINKASIIMIVFCLFMLAIGIILRISVSVRRGHVYKGVGM